MFPRHRFLPAMEAPRLVHLFPLPAPTAHPSNASQTTTHPTQTTTLVYLQPPNPTPTATHPPTAHPLAILSALTPATQPQHQPAYSPTRAFSACTLSAPVAPGYKAFSSPQPDTTKQWRLPIVGQQHRLWVPEGVACDQICGDGSCAEVGVVDIACTGGGGVGGEDQVLGGRL
ncbi:hypothetical protein GJ744_005657 [Endocarpon pusillum]|uniref:Uncharacterized protein n=1 Tax=Endocarpon pusillum TaxID=364733 RepID=A0A8H7A4I9_9EURO|nr:hypothetical protein GJ744_005657 [Endocarpon pusillum]